MSWELFRRNGAARWAEACDAAVPLEDFAPGTQFLGRAGRDQRLLFFSLAKAASVGSLRSAASKTCSTSSSGLLISLRVSLSLIARSSNRATWWMFLSA